METLRSAFQTAVDVAAELSGKKKALHIPPDNVVILVQNIRWIGLVVLCYLLVWNCMSDLCTPHSVS